MTKVADKLREARALIAKGWTRGDYERGGRYCALGAMSKVSTARYRTDYWAMKDALVRANPAIRVRGIANWNDAQKSKRPVLAAFDKAIELVEEFA